MVGWDGRTPAGGQTGDNQHTPGTWWGGTGGHLPAARRGIISTLPYMVGWDGRTPAGGQTGDNQHTPGTWWGGTGGHLLAARREIISTRPVHGGVGRADTCWRPDGG